VLAAGGAGFLVGSLLEPLATPIIQQAFDDATGFREPIVFESRTSRSEPEEAADDSDLNRMEEAERRRRAVERPPSGPGTPQSDADQRVNIEAEQAAKRRVGRGEDIASTRKSRQAAESRRDRIRTENDAVKDERE
jgi:hypothetical protein